jgi:adenine-specific DNA-methyltransferase
MESQYSKLTIDITKKLTKNEKKDYGIYITPNTIITRLYDSVIKNIEEKELNIKNILEPSCGTCEIVNFIDSKMENISIDAIELNDTIYDSIKKLKFKNDVKIIKQNFINYNGNKKTYDLIIGNPPYFVCKKTDVPDEYEEYIYGRPNIFGLFILHSLSFLKNDGILALIIPKSFLNSLYYSKIRNFIKNTCTILKIDNYSDIHDFIDTEQSTFGLILQKNNEFKENNESKENNECNYSMLLNDNFIFTDDSISLKELFEGSTTLEKIGLKVRTGQIVWNEHKEELTDDTDETLLVYNTNISNNNKLELKNFKNIEKGQYITRGGRIDPVLVVNRGNGNSAYKLNYAIIDKGPFLIENHLNEIYSSSKLPAKELLNLYNKIIDSFKNPKTKKFIELFLGNNGLSKTELETIFPIYL